MDLHMDSSLFDLIPQAHLIWNLKHIYHIKLVIWSLFSVVPGHQEMKLLAEVDQPGSLIDNYMTQLSFVLSRKAAGLVSLQARLARFQHRLKEQEILSRKRVPRWNDDCNLLYWWLHILSCNFSFSSHAFYVFFLKMCSSGDLNFESWSLLFSFILSLLYLLCTVISSSHLGFGRRECGLRLGCSHPGFLA